MSEFKWQYTSKMFPMDTLLMQTNEDIHVLLSCLVGDHVFDPECCEATTGSSAIGCWEEGDIDYLADGRRHTLYYDFMALDDSWTIGRVFRFATYVYE